MVTNVSRSKEARPLVPLNLTGVFTLAPLRGSFRARTVVPREISSSPPTWHDASNIKTRQVYPGLTNLAAQQLQGNASPFDTRFWEAIPDTTALWTIRIWRWPDLSVEQSGHKIGYEGG